MEHRVYSTVQERCDAGGSTKYVEYTPYLVIHWYEANSIPGSSVFCTVAPVRCSLVLYALDPIRIIQSNLGAKIRPYKDGHDCFPASEAYTDARGTLVHTEDGAVL